MRENDDASPGVLLTQQQRNGLRGKSGESGQPAKEASDGEEPRFGWEYRIVMEILDSNADEIAAGKVCRKRAQGKGGKYRIQGHAEPPPQPCAQRRTCAHCCYRVDAHLFISDSKFSYFPLSGYIILPEPGRLAGNAGKMPAVLRPRCFPALSRWQEPVLEAPVRKRS